MTSYAQPKVFNEKELMNKLGSEEFRAQLEDMYFIVDCDAGCDDFFAINVLLANGLKPALITTSHFHPSEKAMKVSTQLISQGEYDIPVLPGMGYSEDDDQLAESFQKANPRWPQSLFGPPNDPTTVIGQHWKSYPYNLHDHAEVLQQGLDNYKRLASKRTFIDEARKLAARAIEEDKAIGILSTAPMKTVAEILRQGALEGARVELAIIMSGGLLKEGELKLERLSYNYGMEINDADDFLALFPGTVLILTTDSWKKSDGYLPEESRIQLMQTLSKTDIGSCHADDIDIFNNGKKDPLILLADAYVAYFATHPWDIKSVYPVKMTAKRDKDYVDPEPKASFLDVKPENVVNFEKPDKSNIFFIREINHPEMVKQKIINNILQRAEALQDFSKVEVEFKKYFSSTEDD